MAAVEDTRLLQPESKSPFRGNAVSGWSLSYGAETTNSRLITGRFRGQSGALANARYAADFYLSNDVHGDSIAVPPNGGIAAGSGLFFPGNATPDGLIQDGNLAVDAVPEKFKTTQTAIYVIGGRTYTKTVQTAVVFTAAHVVTASKFGVVLIQINALGTISTKVVSATQAYNDAPTALAAIPSPDPGNIKLGHIAIANNTGDWTANTDDLTNGSDLTTAAFVDGTEVSLTGPSGGRIVSTSGGVFTLTVTETTVKSFYPILVLPSGILVPGAVLAFA